MLDVDDARKDGEAVAVFIGQLPPGITQNPRAIATAVTAWLQYKAASSAVESAMAAMKEQS